VFARQPLVSEPHSHGSDLGDAEVVARWYGWSYRQSIACCDLMMVSTLGKQKASSVESGKSAARPNPSVDQRYCYV